MKFKLDTDLSFFCSFLGRDVSLSSGLTCSSLKFCGNALVSIKMLIISVMGVINISRQFFNTLVGMGSRSHDFDDELTKVFNFKLFNFIFCRTFKMFNLNLISVFCTDGIFCTSFGNLKRIVSILSTRYLEKWSQSDFTDVNSGTTMIIAYSSF